MIGMMTAVGQAQAGPVNCLQVTHPTMSPAERAAEVARARRLAEQRLRFDGGLTAFPERQLLPPGLPAAYTGGFAGVRFKLTPNGRATDCAVVQSSGIAELDAASCRLASDHAIPRPLDRGGRVMSGPVRLGVSWPPPPTLKTSNDPSPCVDMGGAVLLAGPGTVPRFHYDPQLLMRDTAVLYRLGVSVAGEPTICTVIRASTTVATARQTCDLALATLRFLPARGPSGEPVATNVYQVVRFGDGRRAR